MVTDHALSDLREGGGALLAVWDVGALHGRHSVNLPCSIFVRHLGMRWTMSSLNHHPVGTMRTACSFGRIHSKSGKNFEARVFSMLRLPSARNSIGIRPREVAGQPQGSRPRRNGTQFDCIRSAAGSLSRAKGISPMPLVPQKLTQAH